MALHFRSDRERKKHLKSIGVTDKHDQDALCSQMREFEAHNPLPEHLSAQADSDAQSLLATMRGFEQGGRPAEYPQNEVEYVVPIGLNASPGLAGASVSVENSEATRAIRAAVTLRNIDASRLEVRVVHGTAFCRGILATLRTHPDIDLNREMEVITTSVRGRCGIREVIWEVKLRA
jgi:hypothetical protein